MSHSLRGLQDVISLGDWSQLQMQILILLCYLVVAGGIAWMQSHIQHRKRMQNKFLKIKRSYPIVLDDFFFVYKQKCIALFLYTSFYIREGCMVRLFDSLFYICALSILNILKLSMPIVRILWKVFEINIMNVQIKCWHCFT